MSLAAIYAGQSKNSVELARQKFVRGLDEKICIDVPDGDTYNSYYGKLEKDYALADCDETYYKCPNDDSEGCRTIYSGDCNYYRGESCSYTTYFDDFIGEDQYWAEYGSFYNATYWEYYDARVNKTSFVNETSVCDEDCTAAWEEFGEGLAEGAAVAGTAVLGMFVLWCCIIFCVPTIIIIIIICVVCHIIKKGNKEQA